MAAPNLSRDPLEPLPLLEGTHTDKTINDSLLNHVWRGAGKGWWALFGCALSALGLLVIAITYTLYKGIGAWGNNIPVGWAFGIINFVWWIGIGHAGTLISAILLLFQQKWRTSINRFAEAMTLFAVICALLFPLLHTGRPWFAAYWLMPYPSVQRIWPQFKSPLTWDVFAVSTYFTISLLFWFLGLVPDLAALRDSSKSKTKRMIYGIFALGWRGSGRHWAEYKWAYLLLAGLSTPLVLSVHTIVSFDFAVSVLPGWHTTIFPPYFVAGAVFSGFAMVMTWMLPAREFLGLKHVVTFKHLEHGQGHARHGDDGDLRLRDGALHRVVQREPLRVLAVLPRPPARPDGAHLLADDLLQLRGAADLLVQAGPHQRAGALVRLHPDQRRDVV